uniref:Uncharacterized protein n=2 Tax=Paracidobacterium acidisoli TaxID=2303751 RepID=A0A372ITU2_9BACT
MRSPIRHLDAILRWAALLLISFCCADAHAWQAQQVPALPPALNPTPPFSASEPPDHRLEEAERHMAIQRAVQRQKEIADETTRLLVLAQELKADVEKSTKDQLSLHVVKKAEEIEKLAKSVKDKMRDGQ